MSHRSETRGNVIFSVNGKNDFNRHYDQKLQSNGSVNGLTDGTVSLRSLTAPHCSTKFENLQDYLLEVSKALGQRQCFYSVNLADILNKIQTWKEMLPGVEIFYAVKANPDPVLLKLLVMIGTSFDCATEGEIQAVLKAGASPGNILWAHTVKTVEGLKYARSVGVDAMTFDDEEELRKIHRVFPNARLLLRICPSMVKCKFDLSSKFGCSKFHAEYLLRLAKQLDMNVIGISFHVGALCTDPDCFSITIKDCREIFQQARQIGYQLSVLDIGGGFFGASGTESLFSKVAGGIRQALEEHFGDCKVRVIGEPGCYVVGSAFSLVCTVIGKRTVKNSAGEMRKHYFLNESIYGSFFRDYQDYDIRARPLLTDSELMNRAEFETTIFGQTCCSEDVIQKSCRWPELEIGECVLWENMGAYNRAVCSNFCGVPLPATVYVFDHSGKTKPCDFPIESRVREFLEQNAIVIGGDGELTK